MISFLRDNVRWLAGGFMLTLFSSYGQTFFISLSSGGIREELGLSHGDFGWLYMWATLTSAASIPFAGRFADTMRIERYAILVVAGLAAAMTALSQAHNVVVLFLALAGLRFFGQGLMSHASMTAMGRWFSANRGKAVSTAALGHQLGESVMPISFVALAAIIGWRGGWLVNAGLLLAFVLPAIWLLMRVGREPHASEKRKEAEGRQWSRGEVLRDPLFWALMAGLLAPPVIGTTVFFHQVYLTELRGWALGQFAGSTPVISIFAIPTTLIAGHVIDRFGAATLLPIMLVFAAIGNLTIGLVPPAWSIPVYMAGMGSAFGIYASTFGAIWPELYGTRHLGGIKSIVTAMMVFSTALGPGLSGWLIDRGISYPAMIVAMGAYCVAAAAGMLFVARTAKSRSVVAR